MKSDTLFGINIGFSIDWSYVILGLILICIFLLVYLIVTNVKLSKLAKKYDKFMRGRDAETLEEVIYKRFDDIDNLLERDKIKAKQIEDITQNLKIAVQKVGIVKYDAFNEMGGKLSFSLAMLDKENNGYIINAMHSREGCYTYIKEIINGESYIPLGEEEKQALDKALK